jgi:hypothetical protein
MDLEFVHELGYFAFRAFFFWDLIFLFLALVNAWGFLWLAGASHPRQTIFEIPGP